MYCRNGVKPKLRNLWSEIVCLTGLCPMLFSFPLLRFCFALILRERGDLFAFLLLSV